MSLKNNIFASIALAALLLLSGCADKEPAAAVENSLPEPIESAAPEKAPVSPVIITEFMEKNKALLPDGDGEFSDWAELFNAGSESVNLKGWRISDDEEKDGWEFPDVELAPGEYMLVYLSNKDRADGQLHADFAISAEEGLYLKNAQGSIVFQTQCGGCDADVSMAYSADGSWSESICPTPGYENSAAGYEQFQQSMSVSGPLVISEAMSYDGSALWAGERGYCDWVEIKNISAEAIELSDYFLSDDEDELQRYRLPERTLYPGEYYIVVCDDTEGSFADIYPNSGFALSSEGEQLYLSDGDGNLTDFCCLRAIPYGCSYGRLDGESGWYYMESPSPGAKNGAGEHRVSRKPSSPSKDGVFEGVESVTVELQGSGTVRYTLDGSLPDEKSPVYTEPFEVFETCVVRARSFEEAALPSLPLTMSFIINEGHSLPVLSLTTDDPVDFWQMYNGMQKGVEKPGSISLYRENDSFTIGCGISLNGQTSLVLPKKNMGLRFRAAYGDAMLEHDIYGGGVTEFTNLLLRSGQDFEYSIIRNELAQSICELADMKVLNQRSIYGVLYINGEYSGIYTLKEKTNEQMYASYAGVSRDSVSCYEAPVAYGTDFYTDVVSFATQNDMSIQENYEKFCSVMDVDSLIDWLIIEGFCANTDVNQGNLRYCRSSEDDGKWRLMFYDLDAAFRHTGSIYYNLLTEYGANNIQIGAVAYGLKDNAQFRDRLLTRAAELFETVLTNETILSEINRLSAEIAPEVPRDYGRFTMDIEHWHWYLDELRDKIVYNNWRQCCIDALCDAYDLSGQERKYYFGDIDGK